MFNHSSHRIFDQLEQNVVQMRWYINDSGGATGRGYEEENSYMVKKVFKTLMQFKIKKFNSGF